MSNSNGEKNREEKWLACTNKHIHITSKEKIALLYVSGHKSGVNVSDFVLLLLIRYLPGPQLEH